ncbi:hypothetical protein B0H63DRAFT_508378 [Podospora didyma]|uniref:Nephrocystin 3-like N-terminal domain-containing protein n=1 Tax=Podospora didyma TaxID=330526 RepID=A0AAE0P0L8_9PEZI|nr:hypothetical protein B0H63DRAFT_508378 [Podospora didyma]
MPLRERIGRALRAARSPHQQLIDSSDEEDLETATIENDLENLGLTVPFPPYFFQSDIANSASSNPRLIQYDRRLLEASRELLHALQLYSEGKEGKGCLVARILDGDTDAAAELVRDPEKLSAFVSQVLDEQKAKKATISSRFGAIIGKVYPLLSLTLGTTSAVAEGVTFVPVKGTVNALSLLLAIADQEHTKSADFLKQLDRISFQALRVAAVKQSGHEFNDILLEKATNLMTAILVFFKGSLLYLKHDFFHHLWKGILLGPQVYADAKAELTDAIHEFDQALLTEITLRHVSTQPPKSQDPDGLLTIELIQWLQPSHWEVETEFARHCRRRVEGVGKSTIAAYVVQALKAQHPDACVLYFFCKAGGATLNTLSQLVRTLTAQLVPNLESAREHLCERKEKGLDPTKPDALFLYQELFRDALNGCKNEIFVILDGLDECSAEGQMDDVAELLRSMSSLPLKLLVSSRVTSEITKGLSSAAKKELTYDESRGDIQLYVSHIVSEKKSLERGFKSLNIDAAEFLSEKSNGNFLWVKLVLDTLKDTTSGSDFRSVIDLLPKDLEAIYERFFRRLESRGNLELALTILKCVLHSKRPLTMPEMESMVSLILGDDVFVESFVESDLASLLRKTPVEPANLNTVHETFRSYITTESSSKDKCIKTAHSHVKILAACLTTLAAPKKTQNSIRDYAVRFWLDHLAEVFRNTPSITNSELRLVFSKLHLFWASETAMVEWMRAFIFASPNHHYTLGGTMASFHNLVDVLICSEAPRCCGIAENAIAGWKDVEEWLSGILSGSDQLAPKFCSNLYHTWLTTNWEELSTAEWVFRATHSIKRILKDTSCPIEDIKARGNWKQYFSAHAVSELNTLGNLQDLLANADYDDTDGTQIGNHAIALLELKSGECVDRFEEAIDECPDQWHLHEGLAAYYEKHDEIDKAIASLENALKVDTKEFPSSAFTHASLVSKNRRDAGDYEGAVEAFRDDLRYASPSDTNRYWDAMAKVWKSQGDGNKMVDLYKEAVEKYPKAGSAYWEKLAETYGRGGAREMEWQTYRNAMVKDPENRSKYGKEVLQLADHLIALCVWPPVSVVLEQGAKDDPENAAEYHRALGNAYMCQRKWKEALEQFERHAELKDSRWIYHDIGHAYLGLGETAKALMAYKAAVLEARASTKALTMGYVHIIDGEYGKAMRLFKRALSQLASGEEEAHMPINFVQEDDSGQQQLFQLHLQLALCCEATGKLEDMRENLEKAVDDLKPMTLKADADKDRELVYRHHARALFHIGLVEEKLGRKEDARETLTRAVFLLEKTTMEGDDETQKSEEDEAIAALRRAADGADKVGGSTDQPPDLKETKGCMRLQRRLTLPYTTDWYCAQSWQPPRRRGWEEWNEVDFTNKFVLCQGDRTVVVPWGFGHY